MEDVKRLFVVGASGFLGSRLIHAAENTEMQTLGTVYRSSATENCVTFDMLNDSFRNLPDTFRRQTSAPSYAVICSACSRIDLCRTSPESYELNVVKTRELALRLAEAGYRVCFISTDHVFDGKHGGYTENDNVNPVNEYGRQKVLVEQWLEKELPDTLIVRLSKQLCREQSPANIFTQWETSLLRGEPVRHIRGMEISPTDVADSANVILRLLEKRCSGIYHVCGSEHFTRAKLFRIFLEQWAPEKLPDALSSEKDIADFSFSDERPLKTWLNNDKLHSVLGYPFLAMTELAELYCKQNKVSL